MKLTAYTNKALQHFMAMLNQAENTGVTDIRFLRQRIQRHLESQYREMTVKTRKYNKVKRVNSKTCPECGQALMVPVLNNEGLQIIGCKKCRYSEII